MVELKIGKHKYKITSNDEFMDNGACIQLISQSKELTSCGHCPHPVLPKAAVKAINKFKRNQLQHGYGDTVEIFTLTA